MKRKILIFSAFMLLFLFLPACGESSDTADSDSTATAAQESEAASPSESEAPSETGSSSGTTASFEPEQPSGTEEPSGSEAISDPAVSSERSSDADQPSEPGAGDSGNAEAGEYSFIGTVDDVSEHEMMIVVTEGDIQNYGDNVLVSFPDEIDLDVQIGDTVRVTFDGIVMPSLPPRVSASGFEILNSAG